MRNQLSQRIFLVAAARLRCAKQLEGTSLHRVGLGHLNKGGTGGIRFDPAAIATARAEFSHQRVEAVDGMTIGGAAQDLLYPYGWRRFGGRNRIARGTSSPTSAADAQASPDPFCPQGLASRLPHLPKRRSLASTTPVHTPHHPHSRSPTLREPSFAPSPRPSTTQYVWPAF